MTVAWDDQFKRQNIMWKVPRNIRMNDNIVVREDEIAVFYRDGKVLAYLDRPDRYALTSQNVAVLGKLIQALSGVVQQAEVYYLQKRIFDGQFATQGQGGRRPYGLGTRPGAQRGARVQAVPARGGAGGGAGDSDGLRRYGGRPRSRDRHGLRHGVPDARDDRPATAAADEDVPEVRHDESYDDQVLRELRRRHDDRRGQQAVHQVRQDGRAWTEILSGVRRGPGPQMPGRPRRPRRHEVLPGVRQAGCPELIPWTNPRPPLRAGPQCPSFRRRSSWRCARSRRSSSWRTSPTSCSSLPPSGSTSVSGGPD